MNLADLRAGVRMRKTIPFPGTQQQVDLKVLTNAEEQDAEFAAENVFKTAKIGIEFHNVNNFNHEITVQKLYRSLRETGTDHPIAASITDFKSNITPIECDLLVEELNAFLEEFNPSPMTMTAEEFDGVVEGLKKNPSQTIGNISSFATLKRLALCLVQQLPT